MANSYRHLGVPEKSLETLTIADEILHRMSIEQSWWKKLVSKSIMKVRKSSKYDLNSNKTISPIEFDSRNALIKILMVRIYYSKREVEKAIDVLQESLSISQTLEYDKGMADSMSFLGVIYRDKGEEEESLKYQLSSLEIRKKLNLPKDVAYSQHQIGLIYYFNHKLTKALFYFRDAFKIRKKLKNDQDIAATQFIIGMALYLQGDLETAWKHHSEALEIRKAIGNRSDIGMSFLGLGRVCEDRGESDQALEFFAQAVEYNKGSHNLNVAIMSRVLLINQLLERNRMDEADILIQEINEISKSSPNKRIALVAKYVEALKLKGTKRSVNIAKSQEIFEEIVAANLIHPFVTTASMLQLTELLFVELKTYGNEEVLFQLRDLIEKIQIHAKEQNAFPLLAEIYLIKSRLALFDMDLQESKNLLDEAQKMTEDNHLTKCAIKISNEYDKLLDKIHTWSETIDKNSTLAERLEHAEVEDLIIQMIRKRTSDPLEVTQEDPVLFLILANVGVSIYSRKFIDTIEIDDQLIAGFLTAMNAFTSEVFSSEGSLERIKHMDFTIILKPWRNIVICYVFKGQSYSALKKVEKFIKRIETDIEIFHQLINFNASITDETVTHLENITAEIF